MKPEDKEIDDWFRTFIIKLVIVLLLILGTVIYCTSQTKDQVYDYIIASDIKHPQIVFKQVLKETGHLNCKHCSLDRNNLFGFWDGEKFLTFNTWEESIDYYERWQIRKGYNGGDYYEFLIKKWGAPNMSTLYIPRLKRVKI